MLAQYFGPDQLVTSLNGPSIALFAGQRMSLCGLSVATINQDLTVLRSILNFGKEIGALNFVPKVKLLPQKVEDKELPEHRAVWKYIKSLDKRHGDPLLFSMWTGLSWKEIERLEWKDVSISSNYMIVGAREAKTVFRERLLPLGENGHELGIIRPR